MLHNFLTLARAFVAGEEIDLQTKNLAYLSSKEGKTLLSRFKLPVANGYIEMLIRRTLNLPDKQKLEHSHLKEAVVSALLFPLRQVIGSCFATAPAIYIQNEKPERLLLDLYDLMMMGKMKRTFGGEEYVVPISPKWGGKKDDHPLLRVWEYTIASFSDYKTTFSRWNLYSSLGLDPKHKGGIGEFIYSRLQEKLDTFNQEVERLHSDYIRAIDEARVSQALLRQAASYDRIRMRKAELEVRAHHAEACKDMRDKAHENAQGLSKFFPFLIEQYSEKFQEHFLEIFDAEAHYTHEALYEDSPAGFRLVYKHGRSDPAAWTFIKDEKEFFDSLRHFFIAVEPQVSAECEWDGGVKEIELLTTELVHFVDTEGFHNFALKKKKPWSYTSGGSLHTLLKGYFMIEGEITEEKRPIESPSDLLTFLLELLKALPYTITKPFEIDPDASLLMYSPTHAFLLKPGLAPFKEGWLDNGFTYTWIRDNLIDPAKNHYESLRIDRDAQALLASKIIQDDFYPHASSLTLSEFRAYLLKVAPKLEDEIDNLLYQSFPTHPPLLFADTNWLDYAFAFAVNPATLELDLYRISADGKRTFPMNPWRPYLDGTTKENWGVLTRPSDYAGSPLSDLALKLKRI
ncbi:MAG: hypothetical protein KFB93_01320 [Simkaniaceae bacterium]|nr:MAG: hypothetical protein KFB93_01320 [Simkaniaceae bacterium]